MSSAVNSMVQTNNEFNQALSQQKGSALDKDAFMLLLVTQFKYQDPLNPAEDKEFIAQLATFSSLEQLMNLNDSMEGLTSATMQGQMINATSYIGKNVDATGTNVSKTTTDKDNKKFTISTFRYAIGEPSVSGTITVYNSDKQSVYTQDMPAQSAGTYPFEWEGKNNSGAVLPDGIYTIIPTFTNADGKTIQYDAVVDGKVNGVITDNGTTYLTLEDGRNVALANVRRVSDAKTSTGSDNPGVIDAIKTTNTEKNEYSVPLLLYTIDEATTKGSFTVHDANSSVVKIIDMSAQTAGSYNFHWDGKDATGKVVPDGTYRITGSFTNSEGKTVPYNIKSTGFTNIPCDAGTGDTPDNTLPDTGGGTETAKAA